MCFFLIAVTTGFFSNYEAFPTMRLSLKFPLLNILAIEHGRFADCFLACVSFGWTWHMFKACFLFIYVRIPVSFIVTYCYYVCVCSVCVQFSHFVSLTYVFCEVFARVEHAQKWNVYKSGWLSWNRSPQSMQISEKWYMNVHELIPSHEDQRIHFGIGSYPFGVPYWDTLRVFNI
jgi:hypothetical protein